jgi:hypothetical protein
LPLRVQVVTRIKLGQANTGFQPDLQALKICRRFVRWRKKEGQVGSRLRLLIVWTSGISWISSTATRTALPYNAQFGPEEPPELLSGSDWQSRSHNLNLGFSTEVVSCELVTDKDTAQARACGRMRAVYCSRQALGLSSCPLPSLPLSPPHPLALPPVRFQGSLRRWLYSFNCCMHLSVTNQQ